MPMNFSIWMTLKKKILDSKILVIHFFSNGLPCQHLLYMTHDSGMTFSLIASYVVQFNWGDVSHHQQDRIYFTHFRMKQGDQPHLSLWSSGVDFSYTDDFGATINRLVSQGNKFLISNGFIFVAKLQVMMKMDNLSSFFSL
jgi:hypothetical protein